MDWEVFDFLYKKKCFHCYFKPHSSDGTMQQGSNDNMAVSFEQNDVFYK